MSNLANQGNDAAAPGRSQLLTRSWNGQTIRMRNNRICLTDLCKAGETRSGNSVRFSAWLSSARTQRFLQHRAKAASRPILAISRVISDEEDSALIIRETQRGDAWGEKAVGMHLAARISVELEHLICEWMNPRGNATQLVATSTTQGQSKGSGKRPKSYLYVMQRADTGIVKIGFSQTPDKRRDCIEIASGSPILLLGKLATDAPAAAEKALHQELRDYRGLGEWFDLPASKLLSLIAALSAQQGFQMLNDPFVPATLIRSVEDIQALAYAEILPVDVSPETGEYRIERYKNPDCLTVSLGGPGNERNAFSISVVFDENGDFMSHSWCLSESYSGSLSNKYSPMLDVRSLVQAEHFFDFESLPGSSA